MISKKNVKKKKGPISAHPLCVCVHMHIHAHKDINTDMYKLSCIL